MSEEARTDERFADDQTVREIRADLREVRDKLRSLRKTAAFGFAGMSASLIGAVLVVQL